jgi:hypothetical protein
MKSFIQFRNTTSFINALIITCFGLIPLAPDTFGVVPPPDGGYPNFTTAEGQNALFSLTTGAANTAVGWHSLFSDTEGSFNTATGAGTLLFNTSSQNTAVGAAALLLNTTGFGNTAVGTAALLNNTSATVDTPNGGSGSANTAVGNSALSSNTTGGINTAVGAFALNHNTVGNSNIALGNNAGLNLTTGDNNIDIGNFGVVGESSTIRLGNEFQSRTFIAAIRGVTTDVADAVNVVIDSNGQLGTISSSRRFKKEIKPMDQASKVILALKPVTFHYNSDTKDTPQFGLIAEEVAEVNPDLVARDKNGEIYTVRYDAVNAMLLNEFLKEHKKVEELEGAVASLAATVKEQAAQIQKVSAQLEASKPAQVVNNP